MIKMVFLFFKLDPDALRTTIFYSFGILFVVNIAYSVKQIIYKLLMENKFLSPFMLLFYQGCAGCSMCVFDNNYFFSKLSCITYL